MKFNFKILLIIALTSATNLAISQKSWSLEECVSHALEQNLQLKGFQYAKDAKKETYRQSIRDLLPRAEGRSTYGVRYGRSTDPFTNDVVESDFFSNDYTIDATLHLFQGFQKVNFIKASRFLYQAALEDEEQQKYLLAFRIMTAYYDIKFYEGLLSNSIDQAKISQNNYDFVKKQIDIGLKAGSDLYDAEAILLSDELLVTQNKNLLKEAKLILLQEMNLRDATDIILKNDIEISNISNASIATDSIFLKAKKFIPLFKAAEFRENAAKKDLAVARGKLSPLISIFSRFNTGYYETTVDATGSVIPFKNQFEDNASQYIAAGITIPISNAWLGRSNVKQQKINLTIAQNNVKTQEQELLTVIQQLVQEFNALVIEIRQSNKKMEAQELAFITAQKRYEKGLINSLDLFQAKNQFGIAQNENLQVRFRLKINKKKLDFYSGLPIFNIE